MRLIRCVDMLLGSGDLFFNMCEHVAALYILGVVHDACSCVLLRVAACSCVLLRVAACCCVLLRVAACCCVLLRVAACGCVWLRMVAYGCVWAACGCP